MTFPERDIKIKIIIFADYYILSHHNVRTGNINFSAVFGQYGRNRTKIINR